MIERGHIISVLDKGYIKLIDWMGSDEAIIEAARMSTGKGFLGWEPTRRCVHCGLTIHQTNNIGCKENKMGTITHDWEQTQGDAWLLEFLYSNQHMTPFEMCEIVVEVYAPIAVFREWHRHRTQSYNEFSARYSKMPNEHYLPPIPRFQKQATANKQGSAESFDAETANTWRNQMAAEQDMIYNNYDAMIDAGMAKEVARFNTPVSRYSKMRAKTNLRNALGFLLLRRKLNAMSEIRDYANAYGSMIGELFPRTYALFEEWTFNATTFSRTETVALKMLAVNVINHSGMTDELRSFFGDEKRLKSFLAKLEVKS